MSVQGTFTWIYMYMYWNTEVSKMHIHMYMYMLYFKYPVTHSDDSYIWAMKFYRLADNDIVLTTYSLVGKEVGTVNVDANAPAKDDEKNMEDKQVMLLIINNSQCT